MLLLQANPLNTYLDSKPSFTSPQPLAAASGLTIPLSITLSDFKLSAFIILVFSKQKGLTLVFRNDPLESLKVSSTFDSIQFVRDYLQRTIEQQLRNLMMDELPAIIHRLSLQLWCPDAAQKGAETPVDTGDELRVNPFASPPSDPVDASGNLIDLQGLSDLSITGNGEMQSLFSQKNLLRLAALTDSHRTLSLFTPGIRDVVFRAWSGHLDHSDSSSPATLTPSLTKTYSVPGAASTIYTFSDTASGSQGYFPSRPSLVSLNSGNIPSAAAHHRSRPGRKKKTRVVNLRRAKSEAGSSDAMSDDATDTASVNMPMSEPVVAPSVSDADAGVEVKDKSTGKVRFSSTASDGGIPPQMPVPMDLVKRLQDLERTKASLKESHARSPLSQEYDPSEELIASLKASEKIGSAADQHCSNSDTSSVILEQAWIMKMAGEIAKRVYDEKQRRQGNWDADSEPVPPPAYEASSH